MTVTELGGFDAYHVHLHLALKEAVEEYKLLNREREKQPPLTEETATAELTRLYYSLEQKRATVILLSAASVEAVANLYLTTKTTPEQFKALEKATFIEKWTVLPSFFLKGYTFPTGSVLGQDLKLLQNRRNSLLHLKARVTEGGAVTHEGNSPAFAGDEDAFIERCATLAQRLLQHVGSFDPTGVFDIHLTLGLTEALFPLSG